MKLIAVDEVMDGAEKVSSAAIRKLIASGDMAYADRLLGEPYMLRGEVVRGRRLGSQIGFPTANIIMDGSRVMPAFGVYKSYTVVDGKRCESISNIGVKPTVGSEVPLCETHIPGMSGDMYGKTIEVRLISMIRPERKFGGIDDLKAQIAADIDTLKG